MCCSSWQSLVVTESTPAHQSREKSQGLFTTNRFTETLLWCSALGKWERNEEHPESARLMSDSLPWIHPLIQISVMSSNHEHLSHVLQSPIQFGPCLPLQLPLPLSCSLFSPCFFWFPHG